MKHFLTTLAALLALLAITGCEQSTDPAPQPENKVLIASTTVDGLTVDLYADDSLATGYNRVYVRLRRGATIIKDADVLAQPLMDMGMTKHSCPVEQISESADADGFFTGAIIFTMPGTSAQWSVDLQIQDHTSNADVNATVATNVAPANTVNVIRVDDGSKRIVTLKTKSWSVGMNTVNFVIYSTEDGFEYTPVTNLAPYVNPTMPSMGHGSPGNVNPTHSGSGLYTGKVNFTMTGDWDIEFGWTENTMPMVSHFAVLVK